MKEPAFEDVTLESERKRIFKDFMHVLEVKVLTNLKFAEKSAFMSTLNVCFNI